MNADSISNPFGLGLGELARDDSRCVNLRPEHRRHDDLTVNDDCQALAYVVEQRDFLREAILVAGPNGVPYN